MGSVPITTPMPPVIEAQIVIKTLDDETPLVSSWVPYSMAGFEDMRSFMGTEIGRPDGAVMMPTSDTTDVIVPSRRVQTVTINTRDITPSESS